MIMLILFLVFNDNTQNTNIQKLLKKIAISGSINCKNGRALFLDPEIIKMVQFLDPEIVKMVQFLDPEIVKMSTDPLWSINKGRLVLVRHRAQTSQSIHPAQRSQQLTPVLTKNFIEGSTKPTCKHPVKKIRRNNTAPEPRNEILIESSISRVWLSGVFCPIIFQKSRMKEKR